MATGIDVRTLQLALYDPDEPNVPVANVGPPVEPLIAEMAIQDYMRQTAAYSNEALALGAFTPQLRPGIGSG